jgi:hypothetical protein
LRQQPIFLEATNSGLTVGDCFDTFLTQHAYIGWHQKTSYEAKTESKTLNSQRLNQQVS